MIETHCLPTCNLHSLWLLQLEEKERQRQSLAASFEASVKDRFQQDIRLLEDQLQEKNKVDM